MSWNIMVYAEFLDNDNTWKSLTNDNPIFDNYKYYKLDFYDKFDEVNINNTSLSDKFNCYNLTKVKYCLLSQFVEQYNNFINYFNKTVQLVYSALGISVYNDDYDGFYTMCDSNDGIDKLTIPVNKDLPVMLLDEYTNVLKANYVLGLCNIVDYLSLNMNVNSKQIRLLFVEL